jgi:adenylyltransferase/sulfurtransferase
MIPGDLERFSRQVAFAPIGREGQQRIGQGHAVVVGCGALGSTSANTLARAGVGRLTLIDADRLELSNLQRQTLFDERQAAAALSKAEAARECLRAIASGVQVEAVVERLTKENAVSLIGHPDVVVDASDNLPTRYLLNDVCVKQGLPWIYGGCAASFGVVMPVLPGVTPCLRCLFPEPPTETLTCHQVGIIAPIAHVVASLQCAEALKLLSGHREAIRPRLITLDVWDTALAVIPLAGPEPACPCCGDHRYEFLEGTR